MIWEMSKIWTPIKTQVHKPAFSKQVHTLGIGVKFCIFRYRAKIISHSFSAKKTITQEHKKGWLQSRTPGLNTQVILPDWSGGPRWSMVWGCYDPGKAEWARGEGLWLKQWEGVTRMGSADSPPVLRPPTFPTRFPIFLLFLKMLIYEKWTRVHRRDSHGPF